MRAIVFAIVGTIALLVAVVAWLAIDSMPSTPTGAPEGDALLAEEQGMPGEDAAAGAVDSLARIQVSELEALVLRLEEQIGALNDEVLALRVEIQRLETVARGTALPEDYGEALPESIGPGIEDYASVVLIPERRMLNENLTVATPTFLEEFLGRPRDRLSDRCEPMTNEKLKGMLRFEEAGPIEVRMLEPAIESLRRVFERVRAMDEGLYERIDTAGSLCVRQIRGTQDRTSTHSFGLAVDINIDGVLDTFADGKTQLGLLLMSDLFREEGWVWGAGYGREDSMHFEVSREMLTKWREEGRI